MARSRVEGKDVLRASIRTTQMMPDTSVVAGRVTT
jgi:hypothetical protein